MSNQQLTASTKVTVDLKFWKMHRKHCTAYAAHTRCDNYLELPFLVMGEISKNYEVRWRCNISNKKKKNLNN